jgi:hypothetical protein
VFIRVHLWKKFFAAVFAPSRLRGFGCGSAALGNLRNLWINLSVYFVGTYLDPNPNRA